MIDANIENIRFRRKTTHKGKNGTGSITEKYKRHAEKQSIIDKTLEALSKTTGQEFPRSASTWNPDESILPWYICMCDE